MMAASGILGEYKGSQAREVIMAIEEYERLYEQMQAAEEEEPPGESEDSDEPAYVTEGQRGYISTDSDD